MSSPDEDALLAVGERLFGAPSPRGVGPSKVRRLSGPAGATPSRRTTVDVRAKLQALVRGAPEVMVKVSGASRSFGHLRAHFAYISREGEIALEDQDGQVLNGVDGLADVRGDWQASYPIAEERVEDGASGKDARRREAFHLVLSMPAGTSELALKRAVRDFANDEFTGHQYVMALHTPSTDPDPEPSPHPHVHLTVKARSLEGDRLNPRKSDLQRWRERFAQRLLDHGIEASATRRQVRLQREPGRGQKVQQMIARGAQPTRTVRRVPLDAAKAMQRASRDSVMGDLDAAAQLLERSTAAEDRSLASALRDHLQRTEGVGVFDRFRPGPPANGPERER